MTLALGFIATVLVLIGYYLNSVNSRLWAFSIWIIGDLLWVIYDGIIENWPHFLLSAIIISLNIFGIYNMKKIPKNIEENLEN